MTIDIRGFQGTEPPDWPESVRKRESEMARRSQSQVPAKVAGAVSSKRVARGRSEQLWSPCFSVCPLGSGARPESPGRGAADLQSVSLGRVASARFKSCPRMSES